MVHVRRFAPISRNEPRNPWSVAGALCMGMCVWYLRVCAKTSLTGNMERNKWKGFRFIKPSANNVKYLLELPASLISNFAAWVELGKENCAKWKWRGTNFLGNAPLQVCGSCHSAPSDRGGSITLPYFIFQCALARNGWRFDKIFPRWNESLT